MKGKKITGEKDWFRIKKRKFDEEEEDWSELGRGPKKRRVEEEMIGRGKEDEKDLPTRSVIFVEYTEGGVLLKKVKEVLKRLEGIIGCRIKAVEKTGTSLGRLFPLTQLWEGTPCGRLECVTCTQEGEQVYPCNKRNVTYQNICVICNPEG